MYIFIFGYAVSFSGQINVLCLMSYVYLHHVLINLQVLLSQYLHVQGVKSSHKSIVHRVMHSYM